MCSPGTLTLSSPLMLSVASLAASLLRLIEWELSFPLYVALMDTLPAAAEGRMVTTPLSTLTPAGVLTTLHAAESVTAELLLSS